MGLGRGWRAGQHMTQFVEHPHRAHAPGAHHGLCGEQRTGKPLVAHGEVLRTVVEATEFGAAGGHAATETAALLEQRHPVSGLQQRARTGHAGHARTDHREVSGSRGVCRPGLGCGAGGGRWSGTGGLFVVHGAERWLDGMV